MNNALLAAAALSLVTAGVHIFVGGVYIVRPLLAASDITPASRCMNYFCWHITSILLVAQAIGFGWSATHPDDLSLAVLFTGLSGAFAVLCAGVSLRLGIAPYKFPALTLFALTGIVGTAGLALAG